MNKVLLPAIAILSLAAAAQAEVAVELTNVHLCCKSCVTGVEKAAAKISGATTTVDKDAGSVKISAPDAATAQKTVDAIVDAGYYGKSENPAIKLKDTTGAKEAKVTSLTVADVHLCCGKCVTAVQKALGKVKGVTSNTAEKNAKTFEVKGDFSPKELFTALQDAGITGKTAN